MFAAQSPLPALVAHFLTVAFAPLLQWAGLFAFFAFSGSEPERPVLFHFQRQRLHPPISSSFSFTSFTSFTSTNFPFPLKRLFNFRHFPHRQRTKFPRSPPFQYQRPSLQRALIFSTQKSHASETFRRICRFPAPQSEINLITREFRAVPPPTESLWAKSSTRFAIPPAQSWDSRAQSPFNRLSHPASRDFFTRYVSVHASLPSSASVPGRARHWSSAANLSLA